MPEPSSQIHPLVRPYFRLWSRVYDSAFFQVPFFGRVHRQLLAAAEGLDPQSILDVGCGTGELLTKLAAKWPGARLTGLDLSADMLEKAREKSFGSVSAEFVEGNVGEMPFGDASFDLITNTISSHYYLDFPAALSEIARVTRPGGTFLQASLGNGVLRFLPGSLGEEYTAIQAVYRSPRSQERALHTAGFTVERIDRLPLGAWLYVCRRG